VSVSHAHVGASPGPPAPGHPVGDALPDGLNDEFGGFGAFGEDESPELPTSVK